MSVLPIAKLGEPVLRQVAKEVELDRLASPEIQSLIDDIVETMHHARGAGLAAPQVRHPLRIVAIEVKDNPRYPYKPNIPLTILVNPQLEVIGEERFENFEGCLSVPDLRGRVMRHARLRVRAYDRHGQAIEQEVAGISAGTFQHECDHLDGILFVDRLVDSKSLCTWDNFRRYHEDEFRKQVQAVVQKYGA